MKRKFTFLMAAFMLLAFLAVPLGMRGQVTSGTTYSTPSINGLPTGWSGEDGGGTSYIKLIASGHYIQTSTFEQNGFTSIKLKARTFGGPSDAEALITVSWYYNNTETVLGTISPTSKTLTDYTISSPNNPVGNTTGYIKIQCKGAGSSKGSGVSEVTINYTAGGSSAHTLSSAVSPTDAGTVTLSETSLEEGETAEATASANPHFTFNSWSINGGATLSSPTTNPTTVTMGQADATITATFTEDPKYDITYNANYEGSTDAPVVVSNYAGETMTIADYSTFSRTGYNLTSWNTQANGNGTTYNAGAGYTMTDAGLTLYAQWEENNEKLATLNIEAYADANNWVSGTKYVTATVSPVTFTADGGGNTGKYYTTGEEWRFYQTENASITISVTQGYTLVSVKPTYNSTYSGVLKSGNSTIASGSTVAVSGTSVTFTVGNSGTATNGQVKFTNIDVVYVSDGGTQTTSDLAITNTSTDLTFDLYNNADSQVIYYNTSSTGAITITPASPTTYFSYVHDVTAKTITVTPVAVTPSSQTITIEQEADDNYYAGSVPFTVSVANSDPNLPGTENNPYTVAQARAAIDANVGTQGVYARGIVSGIVTAWNDSYITFNFVDNSGDSDFLQAYRCISGTADASAVAVGDIVVVSGNLTKFNTTYEFAKDCELVSLEHPTISVESPSFVLAEGGYATTQNVTLTCATQGATIYYTTNGDTPNNNSTEYNGAIEVSSTTTIKAIAYLNSDASLVSSATYYILSNENNNTVTQALAFGSYPANNVFVHGIVSTAPTEDPNNGALTYYISVNGEATDQLQVYKGKNLNRADFTSQEDIQVGDIVTIFGNVKIYSNQKEFDQGNYLVTFERPVVHTLTVDPTMVSVDSQIHDGNLSISYVNLNIADEKNFDVYYYESDGTTTADYSSWLDAVVMEENNAYIVYYHIEANTDNAPRTGYMRVYVYDEDGIELESDLITVTQAAYTAPSNWVLTSLADLTPADVFVIVGDNGDTYALPSTPTTSAPVATKIGINTGTDPYTLVSNPETALQWNLSIGNDGYVFYPYNTTDKWLNCTNSNNGVKVGDNDSNAKHFTLADNGYLTTTETTSQRYLGVYNSQDWRTYDNVTGNISGQSFSFYKKVSDNVQYEKQNIVAYTGTKDHYYLIASPVASVTPNDGNGFFISDYDLYYFDESQEGYEWRNYEATSFNLVSGKGYLYASNAPTSLTFNGQPYNGNGLVELAYTDGKPFAGWNLIGNPFGTAATLNMPFYKMNDAGDGFTAKIEALTTNTISAMEGVFVQATAANQNAIFTAQTRGGEKNGIARVDFNVTNAQGKVVDNAIVRFDEGQTLEKFMLNANSTKIFFTEDNKDYAIVRSEARGEMPVNFKAAENGTYTIDVEAENLEVNYLHLIDNLTGMDVDLLATPSYTFEARKSDIASRFRLVFDANTGNDETNDNFAFINNGELIVNGNGTVQVIDILGRQMFSHEVNSAFRIQNSSFAPGVYVLRLVNGNDVKTQKIVIK